MTTVLSRSVSAQLGVPEEESSPRRESDSSPRASLINKHERTGLARLLIKWNVWGGKLCSASVRARRYQRVCVISVEKSGTASLALLEWLNEKAGSVGCSKTGLTWTTFRQHEGDLRVASLVAARQGSFLHFTLNWQGWCSVNYQEFGKSLKGCSYLFIKHKDTGSPAVCIAQQTWQMF